MVEFNSLIVFDLETTSLPCADQNTTKITELAFLGCEIKHLKSSTELPRVLHKLVLLFNPHKLIHPEATKVSGLDNELLENVKPFRKEDADMLKEFISRLPSPVCIVAHNGERFDFPILRRAFVLLDTVLGNNVYCADSLKAFREIYPKNTPKSFLKRPHESTDAEIELIHPEKTPQNKRTTSLNSLNYKGEKKPEVRRKLFPDDDELENWMSTQSVSDCLSAPASHKLKDVYEFLVRKNFENAHRAEYDSIALLKCIIHCKEFFNWMNSHSVIFDRVPPLF